MAYTGVAVLALLVQLIINFNVLVNKDGKNSRFSNKSYRRFLFGIIAFHITDACWGYFYDKKIIPLSYITTDLYFAAMIVTLFLWTRFVIDYLHEKNLFTKLCSIAGWAYLICDGITLIINFFLPVRFYFDDDCVYHACTARYIALVIQIMLFLVTAFYVLIVSAELSDREKARYRTIGAFGISMTLCVIFQTVYPLLPVYSIGYLLGTCLIHTIVMEGEKDDYRRELETHISIEELQQVEIGSAKQLAYTDSLTGVKNKRAFTENQTEIEKGLSSGRLKEFGIVVFDLNQLKQVNDTKGHEAGDQYIRDASHIICESFKHSPVYRIGGDEFVVILTGDDYSNRKELIAFFERLMEKNAKSGDLVISSGYEEYRIGHADTFFKVFERADQKMYDRKRYLKEMQNS